MGRNEPYCGAVYVVLFLMADYVSGLLCNMVNIRKVNTPLLVAGYKSLRISPHPECPLFYNIMIYITL